MDGIRILLDFGGFTVRVGTNRAGMNYGMSSGGVSGPELTFICRDMIWYLMIQRQAPALSWSGGSPKERPVCHGLEHP